jgi:hypothetical protein
MVLEKNNKTPEVGQSMDNSEEQIPNNSSFQKENYILHFKSLFLEKEIFQEFHNFMKDREYLAEWLFLCKTRELEKIKEPKRKLSSVKKIIEKFLLEGSPNEIEIPKKSRNSILEFYETLLLETKTFSNGNDWLTQISQILNSIEIFVTEEVLHHSWEPFFKTKTCEALMKKFSKKSFICSPQITQHFDYKDDYFNHPFIFDQDFHFADLLLKENYHWKMLPSNNDQVSSFFTNLNYLPDVECAKHAFTMKYEFILPVSFQRLAFAYHSRDNKLKTDKDCKYFETLNYFHYEDLLKIFQENGWENEIGSFERNLSENVLHLALPFPMNTRIYNHSSSARFDKLNESIMVVMKPYQVNGLEFSKPAMMDICLDLNKPMKKSKVIPLFSFCFTNYKKLNEHSVLFSQVSVVDVGGWASDENVMKLLIQRRASKMKESLMQMCEEFPFFSKNEEMKEILCMEENGKVVDGMGKLLFDLKVDQ